MTVAAGDRLLEKASRETSKSVTIRWQIEENERCKDGRIKFILHAPVLLVLLADVIVIQELDCQVLLGV